MKYSSNTFNLFRRILNKRTDINRITENDSDTLLIVVKVWPSSLSLYLSKSVTSYWSCKFPFSILLGWFYDVGPFERHDFRQLSRIRYFSWALSSRNYKTSAGRIKSSSCSDLYSSGTMTALLSLHSVHSRLHFPFSSSVSSTFRQVFNPSLFSFFPHVSFPVSLNRFYVYIKSRTTYDSE